MAVSTPGFQKYGGAQFQPKLGKGGTLALTSWIGQINKALDETDPENGKTNAKHRSCTN